MVEERLQALARERQELEGIGQEVRADLDYIEARLAGADADTLLAARQAGKASRGNRRHATGQRARSAVASRKQQS